MLKYISDFRNTTKKTTLYHIAHLTLRQWDQSLIAEKPQWITTWFQQKNLANRSPVLE